MRFLRFFSFSRCFQNLLLADTALRRFLLVAPHAWVAVVCSSLTGDPCRPLFTCLSIDPLSALAWVQTSIFKCRTHTRRQLIAEFQKITQHFSPAQVGEAFPDNCCSDSMFEPRLWFRIKRRQIAVHFKRRLQTLLSVSLVCTQNFKSAFAGRKPRQTSTV